jgi:hypothetical protein
VKKVSEKIYLLTFRDSLKWSKLRHPLRGGVPCGNWVGGFGIWFYRFLITCWYIRGPSSTSGRQTRETRLCLTAIKWESLEWALLRGLVGGDSSLRYFVPTKSGQNDHMGVAGNWLRIRCKISRPRSFGRYTPSRMTGLGNSRLLNCLVGTLLQCGLRLDLSAVLLRADKVGAR